jgi:hypothetical protein
MSMHLIAPTKFGSNRQHRVLSAEASSPHWGLNPGPSVYRTDALPLSYKGHAIIHSTFANFRQMPYDLAGAAWAALRQPQVPQLYKRNNIMRSATWLVAMTLWPSGLRRWLQAPVRKGVGSNPTGVSLYYCWHVSKSAMAALTQQARLLTAYEWSQCGCEHKMHYQRHEDIWRMESGLMQHPL